MTCLWILAFPSRWQCYFSEQWKICSVLHSFGHLRTAVPPVAWDRECWVLVLLKRSCNKLPIAKPKIMALFCGVEIINLQWNDWAPAVCWLVGGLGVGLGLFFSRLESSLAWNLLGDFSERLLSWVWSQGVCQIHLGRVLLRPCSATFTQAPQINSDLFFKTGKRWRNLKNNNCHLVTAEQNN